VDSCHFKINKLPYVSSGSSYQNKILQYNKKHF